MELIRPFGALPELKRDEYNENFKSYIFMENFFNADEVTRIRNLWNEDSIKDGKVGEGNLNYEIRKSKVLFINEEENSWIYDKLAMACIMVNANRYKFDISGFQTKLQLTQYGIGEFYDWHLDAGNGKSSARKLSISVQLSGEDEYEGGELEFLKAHKNASAPKTKGTAVIFPSYIGHRVLPVTSGCRMSIVGWIAGPPYR